MIMDKEKEAVINEMYRDLIMSYLEIKPLLFDLYVRNGNRYIDAVLNEMRALNDHIARCYTDGMSVEDVHRELSKAEGHLKRLIYDCFKQLNILFFDYINGYEADYFGKHWLRINDGTFWNDYTSLRYDVVKNVEEAKLFESLDTDKAFGSYQNAYVLQGKVYDLLERYDGELRLSRPMAFWTKMNSLKGWILSTLALAVIPSVLWETPWSEIGDFLIDIFHRGMHGLGVFLMSL